MSTRILASCTATSSLTFRIINVVFPANTSGSTTYVDAVGECFTGDGGTIDTVKMNCCTTYKTSTGGYNCTAQFNVAIYATDSNGLPTGNVLATSNNRSFNSLINSSWTVFDFSTPFQTVDGQKYCAVIRCISGNIGSWGDEEGYAEYYMLVYLAHSSSANLDIVNCNNSVFHHQSIWKTDSSHCLIEVSGDAPDSYTVTYNNNGSTGGSVPVDSGEYLPDEPVYVEANVCNLVKTGSVFKGWAYSASAVTPDFVVSGSTVLPSTFTMGSSNIVLYAVWEQIPSYWVVYDGNGSTGGAVPVDSGSPYVSGSQVMVLGNTGGLVKPNSTLLGWSPSNSALVPTYGAGSLFIISTNTTLYAVWGSAGGGSGGSFDGGVINNSLEIKCKFPYLANAAQVFNWMTAALGNLPDYSAFLRFTNITPNDPALSADVYGLLVRNDDPVNYHSAVGVNDSLYVRQHLFVGGFTRFAETVLPLEKWVNNSPTPTIPSNKRLDVDIGSAAWPFRDIITLSGHIGDLYVPRALYTDYIAGLSDTDYLTIEPRVGQKIKLAGDVHIAGILTGGGSTGGGFDGGAITNPIQLMHKFIVLNGEEDMLNFMFPEWGKPPHPLPTQLGYTLHDTVTSHFNRIFGAISKNPFDPYDEGIPGVALTHHLFVRGDFQVRGMIDSKEGVFVAHGGPKLLGWGPEGIGSNPNAKRNPMLLIKDDSLEGNVAPDTWETRILANKATPPSYDFQYSWANLATNNLLCHGFVGTDSLKSLSSGSNITLNNNLVPSSNHALDLGSLNLAYRDIYGLHIYAGYVDVALGVKAEDIYSPTRQNSYIRYRSTGDMITLEGNVTITGTLNAASSNPFDQSLNKVDAVTFTNVTVAGTPQAQGNITTNGNITCHGALDVSHLRCDGGNFIALYSHIEPYDRYINLGSSTRQFENLYVRNITITGTQTGGNSGWGGGTVQENIIIGNNAKYFGLRNGATRLFSDNDGVLKVQNASGQLGVLDASVVFVDRINSASGQGIYVMDTLKPYGSAINVNGLLNCSGGVTGSDIAIGCAPYGSVSWAYETIQLPSGRNLRINFGSTEKYSFGNNGTFQVNSGNILPASANVGNIGTDTQYWGSAWTNYLRYKNSSSFDALDDLTLVKNYKIMTVTDEIGVKQQVIDHDSLPFLKADCEEAFFDTGKMTGFLLGCVKALVQRVEVLEKQLKQGKTIETGKSAK